MCVSPFVTGSFILERDPQLSFPHVSDESVPTSVLIVVAVIIPLAVAVLYAVLGCRRRHMFLGCRQVSDDGRTVEDEQYLLSGSRGTLYGRWTVFVSLAQSLIFTLMVTQLIKVLLGR